MENRKVRVVEAPDTRCAHPPQVANRSLFNVSFLSATCGKGTLWAVLGEMTKPVQRMGPKASHLDLLRPQVTNSNLIKQIIESFWVEETLLII